MQITFKQLLILAGIFFFLIASVVVLGWLAFFRPHIVDREIRQIRTNEIIRERLVVISNETKAIQKEEKKSYEKITIAGALTNAVDPGSAIALFYALQSNK